MGAEAMMPTSKPLIISNSGLANSAKILFIDTEANHR